MKNILLAIAYLIVSSTLISQSTDDFVTTWDTQLTNNPTNTIELTTDTTDFFDYTVDWGDGSAIETFTGINIPCSHSYAVPGIYQIRVNNHERILYSMSSSRDNLISIDQWGTSQWASFTNSFQNCTNVEILATDAPDLSACIRMIHMFQNCDKVTADISHWDVSNVENFFGMFQGASLYNQDLTGWDLSSARKMESMFHEASSFNQNLGNLTLNPNLRIDAIFTNSGVSDENYDLSIIGWHSQGVNVPSNIVILGADNQYCASVNARQSLIDDYGWNFVTDMLDPNCALNDSDNDGVSNDLDNCLDTPNPGQEDLDSDGIGDICDDDVDGDGVLGSVDCDDYDALINVEVGETCDDGDVNTINDVILTDCSCAGVIACFDVDKDALEAMYNAFDSPTLSGWDFTPGVHLDNSWEGITMTSDGCHVEILSLNQYLGGTLAPEVENLSQLQFLELTDTDIQGAIPSSIGNISTLLQFQAYGNAFTGSIPETMWSLPVLEFLDLAGSNLSGALPEGAANTPALVELVLTDNNFSGCIPDAYIFYCDEYAELYDNDLINNDFDAFCLSGLGSCSDFDGDTHLNENDNCPYDENFAQLDTDNDGIGDTCDPDQDGDGVLDVVDCNPYDGNIFEGASCDDQDDSTINDLIQFDCTCQGDFVDSDADGIADILDNCPVNFNVDQADFDMDGTGDLCDDDIDGDGVLNGSDCAPSDPNVYPGAACDDLDVNTENDVIQADCTCQGTFIDSDDDGITDVMDNCPTTPNTDQNDLDMDGLGDVCDDDIDGDGVLNGDDCSPNDPNLYLDASCDDGLYNTENDRIQSDCTCVGDLIVNDNCNTPINIVDGIYLDVQINGGGGASNNCFTSATDAIYYSYTAPLTGIATVNSGIDLDEPDTRISIYTGSCGALTCHAQNDDISTSNYASNITFNITNGETYLLEWDDRWSIDSFDFEISSSIIYDCQDLQVNFGEACDDGLTATVNDIITTECICSGTAINSSCDDAISISEGVVNGAIISNGNGATNSCQTDATHAIWYLYTASIDGECTITSEIDPNGVDTRLSVFDGPCGTTDCLVFNDDIDVNAINYSSEVVFPVVAGNQYMLEWDDRWSSDAFDFEISVTPFDCPSLEGNIGDSCDDGDVTTKDDEITESCTCVGEYSCVIADKISLEAIYDAWDGPNTNLNWDFSEEALVTNNWTGITVNNGGCVKKIILKSKNLNGIIHPAIGDILSLQNINIIRNPLLTGPIPASIGDLEFLKVLNLQRNNLNGNLSSNLANISNTATLFNVKRNNIVGCIPQSFNSFCGVIDVRLGNNPNWNNNSFQNFCNFGTGGCIESLIDPDEIIVDESNNNKTNIGVYGNKISALIYPNPNTGQELNIGITTKNERPVKVDIRIYDLYGKLILSDTFTTDTKSSIKKIIFNSKLSSGMYFVELLNNDNREVKKLIIE